MKRALIFVLVLGFGISIAVVLRAVQLRTRAHGPAGGSGAIEGVDVNVTS